MSKQKFSEEENRVCEICGRATPAQLFTRHWFKCRSPQELQLSRTQKTETTHENGTQLTVSANIKEKYYIKRFSIAQAMLQVRLNFTPSSRAIYRSKIFNNVAPRNFTHSPHLNTLEISYKNPRGMVLLHTSKPTIQVLKVTCEKIARGLAYKTLKRLRQLNNEIKSVKVIFPSVNLVLELNKKINIFKIARNNENKNVELDDINYNENVSRVKVVCKKNCKHLQKYCFTFLAHRSGKILIYLKNAVNLELDVKNIVKEIVNDIGEAAIID